MTGKPQPDEQHWRALYESRRDALVREAELALGGPSGAAVAGVSADDLVQQAIVETMHEGLRYVGSSAQTYRYLRTRIIWLARDARKRARRQVPMENEEGADAADQPGALSGWDPISDLVDRLQDESDLSTSEEHFRCLNTRQQYVMVEYVQKRRPAWQVAEELKVAPTTVTRLLLEALRRLRKCLQEPGHE